MRDAMTLQLQTVVSAYSEELAALQGQMLQIEGMPASTAQDRELGPGHGRAEAESVGWRAAYEVRNHHQLICQCCRQSEESTLAMFGTFTKQEMIFFNVVGDKLADISPQSALHQSEHSH